MVLEEQSYSGPFLGHILLALATNAYALIAG
jgi:hypothetical protein